MQTYRIVEQPFVAPVDLQTLNTAYNNLQTRHDEAIKATSELKTAVANLNLNEAEEGFRNQLVADIERTIDSNTQYGNAAAAYDDVIKLSGNISSNPALLGRLRAQAEYQKYTQAIDASQMPDDYKEYFKEKNPYYYADAYDNNGNVVGGTTWKPTKSPTTIVNLGDIVDKAIKRVAQEQGQTTMTRWLDKDGKITTDPMKAFDGEVFDVTTSSWQRLGADKIKQSIYAVIEETPGAKESLDQDYEVALWKHNKYKGTSNELTVSDITDENGNILNSTQYLEKRISDQAALAAYNRVITQTTYGDGLSTYLKAKNTPKTEDSSGGAGYDSDIYSMLDSSFRDTPITFKYNKGERAYQMRNNLATQINQTLEGLGLPVEGNTREELEVAIDSIPATINGESTDAIKNQLNYQLMLLDEAEFNLNAIKETMSDSDKAKYDYSLAMMNGGLAVKDRSKFDNRVINTQNELFNGGDKVVLSFDSQSDLNDYLKLFPQDTDFEKLGVKINGATITVDSTNRNIIPLLSSKAADYDRSKSSGFLHSLLRGGDKPSFNISVVDDKWNDVTRHIQYSEFSDDTRNLSKENFIKLGKYYNNAEKYLDKYSEKYDIDAKDVTMSNLDIHGETFTENYTTTMFNLGLMESTEKARIDKQASEAINSSFLNFDPAQYSIYNTEGKITDAKELLQLREDIRLAAKDGRLGKTSALVPGIIDEYSGLSGGYTLTIYPTKEDVKNKDTNKTRQYYIPGLGQESYLEELNQDPTFISSNSLDVLNETLGTKYLTTSRINPGIGDIKLTAIGGRTYVCDFNGHRVTIPKTSAMDLDISIKNYNMIKRYIKSKGITDIKGFLSSNERTINSLNQISDIIAHSTGLSVKTVESMIANDLQR